jgi:hypothetical protein
MEGYIRLSCLIVTFGSIVVSQQTAVAAFNLGSANSLDALNSVTNNVAATTLFHQLKGPSAYEHNHISIDVGVQGAVTPSNSLNSALGTLGAPSLPIPVMSGYVMIRLGLPEPVSLEFGFLPKITVQDDYSIQAFAGAARFSIGEFLGWRSVTADIRAHYSRSTLTYGDTRLVAGRTTIVPVNFDVMGATFSLGKKYKTGRSTEIEPYFGGGMAKLKGAFGEIDTGNPFTNLGINLLLPLVAEEFGSTSYHIQAGVDFKFGGPRIVLEYNLIGKVSTFATGLSITF